ncbi:damage-inducible protein, partial [Achromatium sp. WMS3]
QLAQAQQVPILKPQKVLREHQQSAVKKVVNGFKTVDRGKLIMACGTGKTFTSLKIAEQVAGSGKLVLFLVPSLALLSQTLTEWTQESAIPLHSFAVCSDADVGKKRHSNTDEMQVLTYELRYPATTDAAKLASAIANMQDSRSNKQQNNRHLIVIFATYHSLAVIHTAQQQYGLGIFDLVICDEAHRTTGATFVGQKESFFVRIHDHDYIQAAKRLYMTATPRIYGNLAKATAERDQVTLCSMDDAQLYGPELYVLTFSEAVERKLLVDYKVIVLAIDAKHVSPRIQGLLTDANNQLKVEDATRIVGCWKALAKNHIKQALVDDNAPMQRAVAFCQVIERSPKARSHQVSSKQIASMFAEVVTAYQETLDDKLHANTETWLKCEVEHVDGSMNASTKEAKLNWLKSEPSPNTCRILSNVRCLSEGVDVPALDAVLFLTPRNSQVDVVQSVGRVMRNAPNKKRGYVILPVVIPVDVEPHKALNDNKIYAIVWQVLQALRAHDDRFDATINKLDLVNTVPNNIEVVAITDRLPSQPKARGKANKGTSQAKAKSGKGEFSIAESSGAYSLAAQLPMHFEIGEIENAIYAKLVQKCGNRHHWEDWANDIAQIARTHIERIHSLLQDPKNQKEQAAFTTFATELRDDLNDAITDAEIIEMLAQHLITEPIFTTLFANYPFTQSNPVSQALHKILAILHEQHLAKETDTLEGFYASVKQRAQGIDTAYGKQKIITELYDKFFRNAFPRLTERLGIVYTPLEVVDFILYSVQYLLQLEFGQTLGNPGIHILDPFVGTGSFITRLLQSGLISTERLAHKYQQEIHANEIVLLAYYIATINIEAAFHELVPSAYTPFMGACLTDTFQLYEHDDLVQDLLAENSERRMRQKSLTAIRVIIGNPPYSAGQTSANDNNQNVDYPQLDQRIANTYAARSKATNKNALYDSYIRSIRWATDRIGDSGVIGFVTNAGFLEANTADGLRQCLAEEFSSIYILHLRGNQRTSGELSHKEGGKIFGSGSRAPIAISLLIKNPHKSKPCTINFYDIGDYLSRADKLAKLKGFGSIANVPWQTIAPDKHGDWLQQRDDSFDAFIALGDKKHNTLQVFENYSLGVVTNRDAWCYNASKAKLATNMQNMIAFYNNEVQRFQHTFAKVDKKQREHQVKDFINTDPTKISWSSSLVANFTQFKTSIFYKTKITKSIYRPFHRQWLYYDEMFNHRIGQMPRIFPNATAENLVICVTGIGARSGFSVFMSGNLPDIQLIENGQCFPLYLYETTQKQQPTATDLFSQNQNHPGRKESITDAALKHFQIAYPQQQITKEDIFYYIYGILHCPQYQQKYTANLSKQLPRIPCIPDHFHTFAQAGKDLAKLHVHYEQVPMYQATITGNNTQNYQVTKMRYGKQGKTKDLTQIHYNDHITISNIPKEAYDYIVNGKPAIDWIVERQGIKQDKASGIINDANDYATETMHNPKYPLELLLRVITVSLETRKIIHTMPKIEL